VKPVQKIIKQRHSDENDDEYSRIRSLYLLRAALRRLPSGRCVS
jgi:hypothetical protein